jgi:hypothetical protein
MERFSTIRILVISSAAPLKLPSCIADEIAYYLPLQEMLRRRDFERRSWRW